MHLGVGWGGDGAVVLRLALPSPVGVRPAVVAVDGHVDLRWWGVGAGGGSLVGIGVGEEGRLVFLWSTM